METAYGAERNVPVVEDVVNYLKWCTMMGKIQ
jgi:hypothetical protein